MNLTSQATPKIYVLFVKRLVLFEEIWIWFFKHIYRYLSYKKQYPGNNPTQSSPLEENNDFCYVWTAFSMLSGFEPAAVCFTPPSYKMTNNLNDYYWKRYVLYAHNLLLKGKVSREFWPLFFRFVFRQYIRKNYKFRETVLACSYGALLRMFNQKKLDNLVTQSLYYATVTYPPPHPPTPII